MNNDALEAVLAIKHRSRAPAILLVVLSVFVVLSSCSKKQPESVNTNQVVRNANKAPEEKQKLSLKEALDNQFVKALFCGIGASSGTSIVMAIKSLVNRPLEITIDDAAALRNSDPGSQNMVVHRVEAEYDRETDQEIAKACAEAAHREEDRDSGASEYWKPANLISLQPYRAQLYLLSAYCLDFEKENPGPETGFTVIAQVNSETKQLYASLRQNPTAFETAAIQLATWAVNGDFSPAEIEGKFEFEQTDRDEACRLLRLAGLNPESKRLCAG